MKAMTKTQLADAAGVSHKTLQRWLALHHKQLALLGVTPKTRLLPPTAVKLIADHYGIDI